ncbi:hypothetical protein ACHAXA_007294 [Cyclostephanos tholiformis]|uniref:Uncharacterized protein n=1 Tax=Cyclostephanos tholiformis TaxID=382380 RepID=A0ABD3SHF9_9STRA
MVVNNLRPTENQVKINPSHKGLRREEDNAKPRDGAESGKAYRQRTENEATENEAKEMNPNTYKAERNERLHRTERKTANQFPLTRSLESFRDPNDFFIYVVHTASTSGSGDSSSLEWKEVRWGDLAAKWGRDTSFDDIIQMSTELHNERGMNTESMEGAMKKKFLLHCLPKAASTTLREACMHETLHKCRSFFARKSPPGYRSIIDFFKAVNECTDINHFCVQGGSLEMDVMNFNDGEKGDREPYHFLHLIPFRKFDDWVDAAISQIFYVDGQCERVDKLLDQCLGYRELYIELYTKSVLALLVGMTLNTNWDGNLSKDKHHILLYNYKDTDSIVSLVSNFFGMDSLQRTNRRHKERSSNETCPDSISKKFHDCHYETLLKTTVISNFDAEKKRRKANDIKMKRLVVRSRKQGH